MIYSSIAFGESSEVETNLRYRMQGEASKEVMRDVVNFTDSLNEDSLDLLDTNCEENGFVEDLRYIVVGVSGFGTGKDGRGQPSGAHDNLPFHEGIETTYRLTHGESWREYQSVIDQFRCEGGVQGESDLRLVIMANSWGAGRATKLASRYAQACGREVELFVMVDGVSKPIPTPFRRTPVARRCVNYYQTKSTLRGREIEGCENHNLENECQRKGLAYCHIVVEWEGSSLGAELIRDLM